MRATSRINVSVVYVMLSRVRSLQSLASFGVDEKIRKIIEGGPPTELVGNFDKLFGNKAKRTREIAQDYRSKLGWPAPANASGGSTGLG